MYRTAIFLLGVLLVQIGAAGAERIVERCLEQIRDTRSLKVEMQWTPAATLVQNPRQFQISSKVILQKPDNIYVWISHARETVEIYSNDDGRVYSYASKDRTVDAAKASPEQVVATMVGAPMDNAAAWLAELLHGDDELIRRANSVVDAGATDSANYRIVLAYDDYSVLMTIDRATGLIRRVEYTRAGRARRWKPGKSFPTELRIDMRSWARNFNPGSAVFVSPEERRQAQRIETASPQPSQPQRTRMPRTEKPASSSALRLGENVPDFSLPRADGGIFTLRNHLGRDVIVLDFWATWCPPCRKIMPTMEKLSEEYGNKGLELVAVNVGEHKELVNKFLRAMDLETEVALDANKKVAAQYGASAIPTTVFIGRDGTLQWYKQGVPTDHERVYRLLIEALLQGADLVQ